MRKNKSMKRKVKEKHIIFLFILMIIIGLSLILYPIISNKFNSLNYQRVIGNYSNTVEEIT